MLPPAILCVSGTLVPGSVCIPLVEICFVYLERAHGVGNAIRMMMTLCFLFCCMNAAGKSLGNGKEPSCAHCELIS